MRYFILLTIVSFLVSIQARENPFKPVIDDTVLPISSNQVKKAPPFKSVKVSLPNDARVLTSVAIYYQSIDGSIKKRVVPVDRSIDWHRPLLISQAVQHKGSASTPEKDGTKVSKKESAQKRLKPLPFLEIEIGKKRLRIVTKDKKIRSFHLSNPFKVAIDFKRRAGFLTKHIAIDTAPFKSLDIGNHNGYYRVVVTLDAPYRYEIIRTDDGYVLSLP